MIDTVIPPYHAAYTILNEKIVQQLLTINIDSNQTTIRTLVDSLVCASRNVQNKLSEATKASEQIRNSLDEQIAQLVLSIVNQENKVQESQQSVNQANINIEHAQQQVTTAENTVRDKQNALNAAEHDMHEAQKAVERARLCGRRRRKRGFGKWWRKKVEKPFVHVIRQTAIKPVCSVINSGGIDNAKNRRALAEHTFREAQQRLTQYQQNLVHQRTQHTIVQTQLNEANSQLNILTNQLNEQKAKQIIITSLIKQFKSIEIHLKDVLASSIVLEDAISQLINFELVIVPLHTIYNEMITNNVMNSFNFEISSETITKVLENMIIIVCFLCVSIILGSQQLTPTDLSVISSNIDPLMDQTTIDKAWEDCMITAPATINLLGQVMVVASRVDVSFDHYSPNRVYQHIKYPKSFRATLLQISNDGYRAFLGAHTSMNKIQLYMQQIPQHIKTIIRLLSSKASTSLVSRLLPKVINNIERIGQTCVTLSRGTENSFVTIMDLLGEVLEATEVTRGLHEKDLNDKTIELNVTHIIHADMKREEEIRHQHYEEIRQAVRNAQAEYSRALSDIPTGFKALGLELGRAFIGLVKSFSNSFSSNHMKGFNPSIQQTSGNNGAESFANNQILNFASRFAQSLDSLIERISSSENQTLGEQEFQSFKVIFETFAKMINKIPNSKPKMKAAQLIQRAIDSVDEGINDKNSDIKNQLEVLADEVKPFIAAEQLSSNNNVPISIPTKDDSSKNELLKAQLAQIRLSETEKRLDQQYATYAAAMEQMRVLTAKLANLDLTVIHFKQILEMLREALRLLGLLRQHWHKLVEFFTNFSAQVTTGFDETLKTFLDTTRINIDLEKTEIDRILILELLNGNSINLYHESYTLFMMARTYFDVSKQHLMPRLAGLSLMLTAENDNERQRLLSELERNTLDVQANVTQLVNERKTIYKKIISEKRAAFNEQINNQDANGNELAIIQEGKMLLGYEDTLNE
ncbi:unnamed protein product [Rotaria sordida]|uniref:Uncharacterized protein n=1 Tax=Rotaria sordida TaxID=392033 RepID=A0A814I687_9BILA|nr:unnamed protein product [Rotaria sordida]